jgi:UDP-N-acetylmuramoyl-tripeptide--D-alanyl-D-alanine ligase
VVASERQLLMVERRMGETATAVGGRLAAGAGDAVWRGAVLDSRQVRGGELFFALPGARADGHAFVADALARGAAGAVVARPEAVVSGERTGGVIEVADPAAALHAVTRWVRGAVPRRLAAVTGSTGKTTTKDLLAAMLATRFRTAKSPGNLNNLLGFPLTLLNSADDTEWLVAELGMSEPGELERLSLLARPDVAVFTNVRPVHLEFFGSLRRIAEAKAELLAGLSADGTVVANAEDPEVERLARRFAGRIVWYGLGRGEVRAEGVAALPGGGSRFELVAGAERQEMRLPLHGAYNVENCLAAAAAAWSVGLPLERIAAGAARVEAGKMRGVVHRVALDGGAATVVDDSYNSNPAALARALESAAGLGAGRRWAVLGEMRELGPEGPRFHREAGEHAGGLGFGPVYGVGPLGREIAEGAGDPACWYPDAASAAREVAEELRPGDVVLVKGSRGVGLEAVTRALLARGVAS